MAIRVRYFASLRERMGRAEDLVDPAVGATVLEVWKHVSAGQDLPPNMLTAVNLEYVAWNAPVRDGDEVAFFPPVTGG